MRKTNTTTAEGGVDGGRRKRTTTRKTTKRRAAEERDVKEEDEVRAADPTMNSQVFVPDQMMNDDRELYEAIRKSREEYMQAQQVLQAKKESMEKLKTELALPMSRLKTWMMFADNDHEKSLLRHLLSLLGSYLHDDDLSCEDVFYDTTLRKDLESFLDKLSQSKLYEGVCTITQELLLLHSCEDD